MVLLTRRSTPMWLALTALLLEPGRASLRGSAVNGTVIGVAPGGLEFAKHRRPVQSHDASSMLIQETINPDMVSLFKALPSAPSAELVLIADSPVIFAYYPAMPEVPKDPNDLLAKAPIVSVGCTYLNVVFNELDGRLPGYVYVAPTQDQQIIITGTYTTASSFEWTLQAPTEFSKELGPQDMLVYYIKGTGAIAWKFESTGPASHTLVTREVFEQGQKFSGCKETYMQMNVTSAKVSRAGLDDEVEYVLVFGSNSPDKITITGVVSVDSPGTAITSPSVR